MCQAWYRLASRDTLDPRPQLPMRDHFDRRSEVEAEGSSRIESRKKAWRGAAK